MLDNTELMTIFRLFYLKIIMLIMEKILTRKLNNHQRFKSSLSLFSKNSTMFQFPPRPVDQNGSRNSLPNLLNPSPKHLHKKIFVHEEIYEIVNNCHKLIPCHTPHIPLIPLLLNTHFFIEIVFSSHLKCGISPLFDFRYKWSILEVHLSQ